MYIRVKFISPETNIWGQLTANKRGHLAVNVVNRLKDYGGRISYSAIMYRPVIINLHKSVESRVRDISLWLLIPKRIFCEINATAFVMKKW